MAGFAGYDMPIQYKMGVMQEHLHTRANAGLFDVSHMGQILIRAKSGDVRDAALALETITPVDVADLKPGRQRYGLFTNDKGGLEDDFMVANAATISTWWSTPPASMTTSPASRRRFRTHARSRRSSTAD
jgi:aminomethyltransferase